MPRCSEAPRCHGHPRLQPCTSGRVFAERGIARLMECFACLSAAQHQSEHSLRLAGTAAALRQSIGAPLTPAEESKLEAAIESAREALTENAGATAWLEGWAMPVETAVERLLGPKLKYQE